MLNCVIYLSITSVICKTTFLFLKAFHNCLRHFCWILLLMAFAWWSETIPSLHLSQQNEMADLGHFLSWLNRFRVNKERRSDKYTFTTNSTYFEATYNKESAITLISEVMWTPIWASQHFACRPGRNFPSLESFKKLLRTRVLSKAFDL